MLKQKNRTAAVMFTFLLIASMSASIAMIPTTSAATPHNPAWNIPTFAHIFPTINPIGVGQTTVIYIFLTPTYADTLMVNNYRFHNYNLTIVAPDGQVTTKIFDVIDDTTSNQGYSFTPEQIGTYNLYFNFPGQNVSDYPHLSNSAYLYDYYLPSSANTTLT